MCTVTFSPRKTGYALAMNRDELLTRPPARPPAKIKVSGRSVLCPSEPGGGTWVAVNEGRTCFALINWYTVAARVRRVAVSRGHIILSVASAVATERAAMLLAKSPLAKTNPFRLIGIFPNAQEIVEWQWDLDQLVAKKHRWRLQQWISSGFDEPAAQRTRSLTFDLAKKQVSTGSRDWLRRLHRSHVPESGPLSTCMHRADAATVSYTEVAATPHQVSMNYLPCPPCQKNTTQLFTAALKL